MNTERKFNRRQVLRTAGLGITAGALAACAVTPAPQVAPPAEEATAVQPEAPGAATLAPAELSFWIWWPNPVPALNQAGLAFTEHNPEVKIKAESVSDYWVKLQTALAGGSGPDIFYMNNVTYYSWAHQGILWDLTPYVDLSPGTPEDLKAVNPIALDFYNYQGTYFGVPHGLVITTMGYNETYLAEKGLTPLAEVEDEFDWEMWLEYALTLTEREGDKVSMWGTFSTGGIELGWGNQVISNGGSFLSEDGTKCVIHSEEALEALNLLVDMRFKHGVSPGADSIAAENEYSLFHTGRLASFPLANGLIKSYNEELTDFTYNIATLPKAPRTGESRCYSNICGICVNKDGGAKDQASYFALFNLSKQASDMYSYADVLAPARTDSARNHFDPLISGPANRSAFFRQFETIEPLPTHPTVTWNEMMQPVTEWQLEIFEGRVTVEEGLQGMEDEVNALFDAAAD